MNLTRLRDAMGPTGFLLSVIALTVALSSGAAVAATLVTTNQIANNAVTGAKVKDGSLTLADLSSSTVKSLAGKVAAQAKVVTSREVTVGGGGSIGAATATCPSGTTAVGGGFLSGYGIATTVPILSKPTKGAHGWEVEAQNLSSGTASYVQAYVVCL